MAEPPVAKPLWEYGVPDATTGGVNDCPVNHIDSFLEKCDTFKINNVSDDAIRLRLFPFSLRDRAKEWLKDEGISTFDSWDKLVKAFLAKFLGQEKTARLRTELSTLRQLDDESLYWRRIYIDAASGGNFVEKVPIEAKAFLEKMAANDNFHSGGRKSAKKGGKHEVDAMTLLTSTVQALSLKVDQLRAGPSVVASCETCRVQGHITSEFQYAEMLMEQANALCNNNQQRRPYNPYSSTYNEAPSNHIRVEDLPRKVVQKKAVAVEEEMVKDEKMIEKEKIEEKKKPAVIEPYKPPVPFPQRLAQAKLEKKYGKFLDILKKLQINIPFLDTISEMPSYAKFLKDMLSNKRKIEENAMNKLPKKLGDPGSYSIPTKLGDIKIKKALYDLGASVSLMPLSICKKLQMGELKPTRISLQLADRSVKFPLGILEDVPLRAGKFFILCDFVVMEMKEDKGIEVERAKIEVIEHLPPPILPEAPIIPSTFEGASSSFTPIERALVKLQNSVDKIKDELNKLKESLSSMFAALENLNTWMKSQGFLNHPPPL
ncbi:uncharacterized protein LOC125369942 [Ricinus communis]|uniref:uncharacterized protein LOC125369942 n=1 Tax=Ricinus communis TaxID=3988 RepID=UPI00201B3180|nr:uncharacterized protein LOC125369942 [Ricinus communis]